MMRLLFFLIVSFGNTFVSESQNPWTAPAKSNNYENPFKGNAVVLSSGMKLYQELCAICHGPKGKGDGIAGMTLKPRPANLTKDVVQIQSDGAIFWKITEGRAPMASYKEVLTDEQRWQLVNYIRKLGGK